MDDNQKLEFLRNYERQNPQKYLSKYGKVIGNVPVGQPFAGQPNKWEYVSPEEALKKIFPTYYATTGSLQVDITEKPVVEHEFVNEEPVKRERKAKDV